MGTDEKLEYSKKGLDEAHTQDKFIETYAEDVTKFIDKSQGGLIKKIIYEQEYYEAENQKTSPELKKNKLFVLISVLLVFSALAVLFFLKTLKKEIYTTEVREQPKQIIFTDRAGFNEIKDFSKDEIIKTILNQANVADLKNGEINGVYLTENKKVIELSRFFEIFKINPFMEGVNVDPEKINLFKKNFLIGTLDKNLFILLKVGSMGEIFEAMRFWEEKIFQDLHEFFNITLSSENNYLVTKDFEDAIIQNKNARVLYDKDNKIIIMYIFMDDSSILLTREEALVREVLERLF
jgi:hypothetical protein